MRDTQTLYGELKSDLQAVTDPLVELATQQVSKRGAFLPFGGLLKRNGDVALQAAAPETDTASADDVLPLLLAGLQHSAALDDVDAAAVCEWVRIGTDGGKLRDAVKVHVHHRRGLAVAFYLPATKSLLRGWQFGDVLVRPAGSLIEEWVDVSGM